MAFTDPVFLIFCTGLLAVLLIWKRIATWFIVLVSILFYGGFGIALPGLAILSSTIDLIAARRMGKGAAYRRFWLWLGIVSNLAILLGVKLAYYTEFFAETDSPVLASVVPIGISFYALQSIGFLIDVYKGKVNPPERYMDYLAYILFFPQLLAGPIERAGRLIPQLQKARLPGSDKIAFGLKLIAAGLYLKLVVANRLALPVNEVANAGRHDLIFLANGGLVFIYIYADFFSYTLIARGLAAFLNIDLNRNFDRPFRKRNITSFWQSWHMSLTRWMTDYVYIPLAQKFRGDATAKFVFTLLTMTLIGLWHGIAWNFVLFGVLNGLALRVNRGIAEGLARVMPFSVALFERGLLILTLCVTGNIFLFADTQTLVNLANPAALSLLHPDSFAALRLGTIGLALACALPFVVNEMVLRNDVFARPQSRIFWDLVIAAGFACLTVLLFSAREAGFVYVQF